MYQFFLQVGPHIKQCGPSGFQEIKLRGERDNNNIFFREKISGNLELRKPEFTFLYNLLNSELNCSDAKFLIFENKNLRWKGVFSLTDATYNLSNCTVKLSKIESDDKYKYVLDRWSKEVNILNIPAANIPVSAKISDGREFEFKRIELGKIGDEDFSWQSFLEVTYWVEGNIFQRGVKAKNQVLFRLKKTLPLENGKPVELQGWQVEKEENGNAYYVKRADLYNFSPYKIETKSDFNKYSDLVLINVNSNYDTNNYIKVTGSGGANDGICNGNGLNFRRNVDENRCLDVIWGYGLSKFNRGRKFIDVLYYIVEQTCPEVLPKTREQLSSFFTSENSIIDNLPNRLKNMLVFAKSDVSSTGSTEAATIANVKLKEILDELTKLFNTRWDLTEDNKLRIEHLSFYENSGVIDLTQEKYAIFTKGKSEFSFEKSKMPQFELLKYAEYFNENFRIGKIEYLGNCVNKLEGQNTEESTITLFNNDLDSLILNSESIDKNGLTLMVHKEGKVLTEYSSVTNEETPNFHLSAVNLIEFYFRDSRVLYTGLVNGANSYFKSISRNKKQVSITFDSSHKEVISEYAKYKTEISDNGILDYYELSFEKNTIEVSVIHETTPNVLNKIPARSFDDSFPKSFA